MHTQTQDLFGKAKCHDFLSREFRSNPYPLYEEIRKDDPVYWSQQIRNWFLVNYSDAAAAFRDKRLSAGRTDGMLAKVPDFDQEKFPFLRRSLSRWVLNLDAPEHTILRTIISKGFVARDMESLMPRIRELVCSLLDDVVHKGEMNIVRDLAYPLPVIVIAEILGVPTEDRDRLKEWSDGISGFLANAAPTFEAIVRAENSIKAMNAYLLDVVTERRKHPRDGFLDELIHAQEKNETFTDEDLIASCTTLIFAGHETTTNLICNSFLILGKNPDIYSRLLKEPELIPSAVEEFLRYESPVQWLNRVAKEDPEINGKKIREGGIIGIMVGAANRDPARFVNPDVIDIARSDNRHLSFGYGAHFCMGAMLSRIETKTVIHEFSKRISKFDILNDESSLDWLDELAFRGLKSLPIRF